MRKPSFILTALALVALSIYLFVSAPPALPETADEAGAVIPIANVLETVAAENNIARALYTRDIVGKSQVSGLKYDERWKEEGLEAGPLPALFLREAAQSLQKSPVPLGLFLGSDFPITPANRFKGKQAEAFERIKRTRAPEFFHSEETGEHTAMFPDVAGVPGCVSCHNEHAESPKKDWKLDDMMGATTWSYPKGTVSQDEYLRIVSAVRQSFRDAYEGYLAKAATFADPPEVGERWPAEGRYLPSPDVFMAEFARLASAATVDRLLARPDTAPSAPVAGR